MTAIPASAPSPDAALADVLRTTHEGMVAPGKASTLDAGEAERRTWRHLDDARRHEQDRKRDEMIARRAAAVGMDPLDYVLSPLFDDHIVW